MIENQDKVEMKYIIRILLLIIPVLVFAGGPKKISPAELKSISAEFENDIITIDWKTASEVNTDKFFVFRAVETERSRTEFEKIGEVEAAGSSISEKHYSFEDNGFTGGKINFYKIRIIDKDGSYAESSEIAYQIDNIIFDPGYKFTPVLEGNRVNISWATEYETAIDSFLVTRKIENYSEEKIIAKVKAKGNSAESEFYGNYVDEHLAANKIHDYRLYSIMDKGQVRLLEIESINYITSVSDFDYDLSSYVYPNPFTSNAIIKLPSGLANDITFQMFDISGNLVKKVNFSDAESRTEIGIDSYGLCSGIYYYLISSGSVSSKGIITILK